MLFLDKISHLFAFRTLVVTTAVVLVYAAIFTSTVIIEEDPPDVGQKDSLDVAWRDLQVVRTFFQRHLRV
jgi:cell division protein FtsL